MNWGGGEAEGNSEGQWEGLLISPALCYAEWRAWWWRLARQIQDRDIESLDQLED